MGQTMVTKNIDEIADVKAMEKNGFDVYTT
jgi:hypothetical protein